MSELLSQSKNLHQVADLQEIGVRDGVILTTLQENDGVDLLHILDNDPSIRDRVAFASNVQDLDEYHAQLDSIALDPHLLRYGIHEDGTLVGVVSFWRNDGFFNGIPQPTEYGFGFFLDPNARGRGLVAQSVESIMDKAEKCLDVGKFIAFCEPDNPESQAVLKKLGFEATGDVYSEPNQGWEEHKYARPPKHTRAAEWQSDDA